jgi:hypothetical protein
VGGIFASAAGADQLFDFTHDPLDPARNTPPLEAGFTPAPFLTTANQTAVGTYFTGPGAPAVRAVKIQTAPVVTGTLYSAPNTRPKYTFMDFEGVNPHPQVVAQSQFINTQSGGAVAGNQIFVGNFNYYPVPNDPTRPGAVITTVASSFQFPHSASNYYTAGLNMANEALYPGAPDFRNRANNNSTAPNIRSGFMTLPITRLSLTTSNLPTGHKHIPYITRFNNYGNTAFDSDGNAANGFVWNNPIPAGQPAQNGQLLSRGDFSALVAHYRARGADGVHLLDGGVVGYTRPQFEQDAKAGWEFAPFQQILQGGGARLATLDTLIRSDGTLKNIEDAGMVYSGLYSLTQNGGAGRLALLVSNLDENPHTFDIPQKIGGKTVIMGAQSVLAGQHRLLEFTGAGTQWQLVSNTPVFTDNDRSGTGVPEPAVMGTIALAGLMTLGRRRQRI